MHRSRCVRKPCMCKAYNHPKRTRVQGERQEEEMLTLLFGETEPPLRFGGDLVSGVGDGVEQLHAVI